MRLTALLTCCLILWASSSVAIYVPPGLNPGDHYQIVIVTSLVTALDTDTTVPPAIPFWGGIDAADYIINYSVAASGYLDNWNFSDITWKAILSTPTVDARDRISVQAPIYNTHGELVATDAADLWDGSIAHAIQYDESGSKNLSTFNVWTGTASNGVHTGSTAGANWNETVAKSALVGNLQVTNGGWTQSFATSAQTGTARL